MGAVNTTYTFTATDTITSSKMNNIIDQTTMTSDAIIGTTLEVASGQLKIRSQGITSNELAANAVTSTQITSGSVDPSKLSIGYPLWTTSGDLTVNGATTALSSVTANTASVSIGSARTASGASNIDFNSTFPLTSYEARISRETGANGNLVISNTGTGSIVFNSTPLGAVTGTAPIYGARAWMAMKSIGSARTTDGKTLAISNSSSGVCTVTYSNHGFRTGHQFWLQFSSLIVSKVYTVTVINANSFTVQTTYLTATTTPTVSIALYNVFGSGNVNSVSSFNSLEINPGYLIVNLNEPMPDNKYSIVSISSYSHPNLDDTDTSPATQNPSPNQTTNSFWITNNSTARYINVVVFG